MLCGGLQKRRRLEDSDELGTTGGNCVQFVALRWAPEMERLPFATLAAAALGFFLRAGLDRIGSEARLKDCSVSPQWNVWWSRVCEAASQL